MHNPILLHTAFGPDFPLPVVLKKICINDVTNGSTIHGYRHLLKVLDCADILTDGSCCRSATEMETTTSLGIREEMYNLHASTPSVPTQQSIPDAISGLTVLLARSSTVLLMVTTRV